MLFILYSIIFYIFVGLFFAFQFVFYRQEIVKIHKGTIFVACFLWPLFLFNALIYLKHYIKRQK